MDQAVKVIKGVGEVGIDTEASPGNGRWYVKHYATGYDVCGFDSEQEALDELLDNYFNEIQQISSVIHSIFDVSLDLS